MPRDHHFAFAKQVLPQEVFRNPDRVFAELRGPMREPFLFFLWQELGKTLPSPIPHCAPGVKAPGGMEELVTLDVVGADLRHGTEVVVVQMPPPEQPNEAWYLALLRNTQGVRIFSWERSAEGDAVLAEIRPDGRANFGFYPNWSLEGFMDALSELVGVALHGLPKPTSTPMDAVRAGRPGASMGKIVSKLALARAGLAAFLWMAGFVVPGLFYELGYGFNQLLDLGIMLLSLAIGVTMLVWLYRVFTELKGRAHYSPGWAVGSWFIPIANFILPAFVLKDAWRTSRGNEQGSGLVYGFWVAWIAQTIWTMADQPGFDGELSPLMGAWMDFTVDTFPDPATAFTIFGFVSMAVTVTCYGLLHVVVRKISLEP